MMLVIYSTAKLKQREKETPSHRRRKQVGGCCIYGDTFRKSNPIHVGQGSCRNDEVRRNIQRKHILAEARAVKALIVLGKKTVSGFYWVC